MKSDIAEKIGGWVEKKLNLPFLVYMDLIPDPECDAACLRHDPSPAAEKRFIDGTRLVSWNFTFFIRCKNAGNARMYAKLIIDKIDGQTIGDEDGEENAMYVEAVTLAQYIDTDAKGYTTYSTSIKCTYLEQLEAD